MKTLTLIILTIVFTNAYAQTNNHTKSIVSIIGNESITKSYEQTPKNIETIKSDIFLNQNNNTKEIFNKSDNIDDSNSNNNKRLAYFGFSIGTSIPLGDFADESRLNAKTGLHINLMNFGYLFTKHIGISIVANGSIHEHNTLGYEPWILKSIYAGPLFSFPFSKNIEFDFKPMIGYSITSKPVIGSINEEGNSTSFNIETLLRYHLSNYLSMTFNIDYFITKPHFENKVFYDDIKTLTFGIGCAYRLIPSKK